jgi:hypothetical protein
MDPGQVISNIIMGAGVLIAAIAAWIAVMQARRAEAAQVAAEAAGDRAAKALEELASIERARDEARIPWIVTRERPGGDRWRVVNNTGGVAQLAEFTPTSSGHFQMEDGLETRTVPNGSPVFIAFGGSIADPASIGVRVDWVDSNGSGRRAEITLG